MAEDNGDYVPKLPEGDLDALCAKVASCAITMSPYEQLAVIKSFGLDPDSPEDMQILYTAVKIALSRSPRERGPSRSPSPDGYSAPRYLNLREDVDTQDLPEPLQASVTITNRRNIPKLGTTSFASGMSEDPALRDISVSLQKMQISRRLASQRDGINASSYNTTPFRAAPYVHRAAQSSTKMARQHTLNQNHIGCHDGKEFIGQQQRDPDDPLACIWNRSSCKAIIPSGRDEDILAHLVHHHGFVISGAPILKQMCQWGDKCRIYVHDADMVEHIARKGRSEDHCRFDEHKCKMCFKCFANVDKLIGHAIKTHRGVVLH